MPVLWYSQTKRPRLGQSHEPSGGAAGTPGLPGYRCQCSFLPFQTQEGAMCRAAGCQMVASPPYTCLPACYPGPHGASVPRIGFKFVNTFPIGSVDVNRAREVFPTACTWLPASSVFSFHCAPSPGGLALCSPSYPQGPALLCPRVPLGCLVQALYCFPFLYLIPLCSTSLLCHVFSNLAPAPSLPPPLSLQAL